VTAAVVSFENAGLRFDETRWIWRNASFVIPNGSFVAVLGPNGAGKSTLLKVILGLLPLAEGRALVSGTSPRRGNATIGYMPQVRHIEPECALRGRDMVRFGVDGHCWGVPGWSRAREAAIAKRVEAAIDAVGAGAYADRRIGSLSGGEAQRLYLAQALVGDPEILVLDEPLASLDIRGQASILALIARIARERAIAVLLVAHGINGVLPYVDRIVYIARGVVHSGSADELVNSQALSRIYGTEIEVILDRHGRRWVTDPEVIP
jgi:zinc/manganese transport system ATP-binding protein